MNKISTIICFTFALLFGSALETESSNIKFVSSHESLWNTLKLKDHFALIRHALAPGYGDPKEFNLEECNTQRNLDDRGRHQSKKMGDLFRSNGVSKAIIYSSQWCRCLETARLLKLGKVVEVTSLNSFFQRFDKKKSQTEKTLQWLRQEPLLFPTIIVTHQVNISAITNYFPDSGEIIFIKRESDSSLTVLGSVQTLNL